MVNGLSRFLRNVGFASISYCVTCFVCAVTIYLAFVLTGNVVLSDVKGEVVDAAVPISTFFLSSFFVAATTTMFCLGGLLGVFLLVARHDGDLIHHALNAAFLALIASGVFTIESTLGEDHFALRAFEVAGICAVAAILARSYLGQQCGSNHLPMSDVG